MWQSPGPETTGLPVGMDAVWQGIAGTSIELEVRERFFRIDMGNWQVSHTQEEPNLLSNYQNRSLGIGIAVKPCYLTLENKVGLEN